MKTENTILVKSPLNYMGGKYKILPQILTILPHANVFVDLFAGGFNVGINADADKIICNDRVYQIIDLYCYFQSHNIENIIDSIKERINEFHLDKKNEQGYKDLRIRYNKSRSVIDFFVLICYGFNHQIRFNGNQEFNNPFGKDRSSYNPSIEKKLINFVEQIQKKDIQFFCSDFSDFDLSFLRKGDLVYCDPPYLLSTACYNDGDRGFKAWTEAEERNLLKMLDELSDRGIWFALSNVFSHKGMENCLLKEWSKCYKTYHINNSYANCNYHKKERQQYTDEILITNF